jgi:diguanylate cyclase (GGDEF)-like protein/PAS domain S-box-containing protein
VLKTALALRSRYLSNFLWLLLLYALIILALSGTGEGEFEQLHLVLDTSNAILSLLLAVFLLGEQHAIKPSVRSYLAIGFGLAAATELLHALVGIEWVGWFSWIATHTDTLRPATWPPSTYLLPLSLAWTFWLMRRNSALQPAVFAAGMVLLTVGLFALSFMLPRYVDTGILGIQRPTQAPLLLLWLGVIVVYWRERHVHPLYEGLAMMGVLLFLSDLCMLYSTSPHEKFTMMAHAGKLIAYALLHIIQMRIAAVDSRGRSAAEASLRENEASLRAILDNSPYLAWLKDPAGRYVRINKVYADYVRLEDARQVIGKTDFDLWPQEMAEKYRADDAEVMARRRQKRIEETSLDGDRVHWVETFKTPILDENGNVLGTVGFACDITERKQAEEQIYNLAFYDTLTQLPNRRLLDDRMGQAIASSKRSSRYGALMFLDLDNFKPLNDMYGHHAGDLLLIEVAHRITSCVREVDTVARFGGDEFVVMLSELDADKAESTAQAGNVAEKIRAILAEPYVLKLQQSDNAETVIKHHCAASIGVAIFNSGSNPEDILKWADMAMYQSKERGRNRVYFYGS